MPPVLPLTNKGAKTKGMTPKAKKSVLSKASKTRKMRLITGASASVLGKGAAKKAARALSKGETIIINVPKGNEAKEVKQSFTKTYEKVQSLESSVHSLVKTIGTMQKSLGKMSAMAEKKNSATQRIQATVQPDKVSNLQPVEIPFGNERFLYYPGAPEGRQFYQSSKKGTAGRIASDEEQKSLRTIIRSQPKIEHLRPTEPQPAAIAQPKKTEATPSLEPVQQELPLVVPKHERKTKTAEKKEARARREAHEQQLRELKEKHEKQLEEINEKAEKQGNMWSGIITALTGMDGSGIGNFVASKTKDKLKKAMTKEKVDVPGVDLPPDEEKKILSDNKSGLKVAIFKPSTDKPKPSLTPDSGSTTSVEKSEGETAADDSGKGDDAATKKGSKKDKYKEERRRERKETRIKELAEKKGKRGADLLKALTGQDSSGFGELIKNRERKRITETLAERAKETKEQKAARLAANREARAKNPLVRAKKAVGRMGTNVAQGATRMTTNLASKASGALNAARGLATAPAMGGGAALLAGKALMVGAVGYGAYKGAQALGMGELGSKMSSGVSDFFGQGKEAGDAAAAPVVLKNRPAKGNITRAPASVTKPAAAASTAAAAPSASPVTKPTLAPTSVPPSEKPKELPDKPKVTDSKEENEPATKADIQRMASATARIVASMGKAVARPARPTGGSARGIIVRNNESTYNRILDEQFVHPLERGR